MVFADHDFSYPDKRDSRITRRQRLVKAPRRRHGSHRWLVTWIVENATRREALESLKAHTPAIP